MAVREVQRAVLPRATLNHNAWLQLPCSCRHRYIISLHAIVPDHASKHWGKAWLFDFLATLRYVSYKSNTLIVIKLIKRLWHFWGTEKSQCLVNKFWNTTITVFLINSSPETVCTQVGKSLLWLLRFQSLAPLFVPAHLSLYVNSYS